MSWNVTFKVIDCTNQSPITAATVHIKGYFHYEDQEPAESYTHFTDNNGLLAIAARDDVFNVDVLIGKVGHVAKLNRVSRQDVAGEIVEICLGRSQPSGGTKAPEALTVAGWGDDHVDLMWWNGEDYRKILVGWTDVTRSPGSHNQLPDLGGSTTSARIHYGVVRGNTYILKVKGYSSRAGYSAWTELRWVCPIASSSAPGPAPLPRSVQAGWRWCLRCQRLVFAASGGKCIDGKPHFTVNSGKYSLLHGYSSNLPGTQEGWRWCNRCQGLAYGVHGNGVCYDGQPHDLSKSGKYDVYHGDTPAGTQAGWRWCARCQGLVYGVNGDGICQPGRSHDLGQSGKYSVLHQP